MIRIVGSWASVPPHGGAVASTLAMERPYSVGTPLSGEGAQAADTVIHRSRGGGMPYGSSSHQKRFSTPRTVSSRSEGSCPSGRTQSKSGRPEPMGAFRKKTSSAKDRGPHSRSVTQPMKRFPV